MAQMLAFEGQVSYMIVMTGHSGYHLSTPTENTNDSPLS